MSEADANSRPVSSVRYTHAEAQSVENMRDIQGLKGGSLVFLGRPGPCTGNYVGLNMHTGRQAKHTQEVQGLTVHMCGQAHTSTYM